jgi:hypothetical protein
MREYCGTFFGRLLRRWARIEATDHAGVPHTRPSKRQRAAQQTQPCVVLHMDVGNFA